MTGVQTCALPIFTVPHECIGGDTILEDVEIGAGGGKGPQNGPLLTLLDGAAETTAAESAVFFITCSDRIRYRNNFLSLSLCPSLPVKDVAAAVALKIMDLIILTTTSKHCNTSAGDMPNLLDRDSTDCSECTVAMKVESQV